MTTASHFKGRAPPLSIFLDDAIAARGFQSATHLCRLFRRRKGTDKSPIVDPCGAEIGATNDRLVAAKLARVFRLQSPKRGLGPAFAALRCHLNRIATGYDGSGHCGPCIRIGMCHRDGSQMLAVRRSCVVCAARLVGAVRCRGNGKTRCRSSRPCVLHRWFRRRLTSGRRRGGARPGQQSARGRF